MRFPATIFNMIVRPRGEEASITPCQRAVLSSPTVKTRHTALAALFLGLIGLEIAHGFTRISALEERERQSLLERVRRGQVELSNELKRSLEEERAHALYLARSQAVRAVLEAGRDDQVDALDRARQELAADLRPYVLSFGGIDRVAVLDNSGRELCRSERIGQGVGSIPPLLLDRDVDAGILALARQARQGTVVIAGILHDSRRVEVPRDDRQVLYFLAPVDSPQGRLGHVALSAYATPILQRVRAFAPAPAVATCLVDADGSYLAHPERNREKGHSLGRNLSQDHPEVAAVILAGAAETASGGSLFLALAVAGSEPAWKIVSQVSPRAFAQVTAGLSVEYSWIVAAVLGITIVLGIAGFLLIRMSVREVELREQARYRKQEEEMQRRVALSERLGSLGLLTAGVAHEINNPLEGIENYLALLEREQASEEKRKRYVDMVRHGFHRIRDIVRDLSAFSRPGVESTTIDLAAAIQQALRMLTYTRELKQVTVKLQGLETQLLVPGDSRRLEQVFINLLLNAARAMNGKGELWISARSLPGPGDERMMEVTIDDNGPGIPETVLPKIFDPFFTTTDGTGLGLSICFGILQAHAGAIRAENRAEGGARFVVTLPASAPQTAGTLRVRSES